jgi:hypothetical protein
MFFFINRLRNYLSLVTPDYMLLMWLQWWHSPTLSYSISTSILLKMVTSVIKFLIACEFIHVIVPSSPSEHKREEDGWCHGTNHGGRGRRWADRNRGVIGWVETEVLQPWWRWIRDTIVDLMIKVVEGEEKIERWWHMCLRIKFDKRLR